MSYEYTKKVTEYYDQRAEGKEDAISVAGQWFPKERTSEICDVICTKSNLSKKNIVLEVGSGSDVLGSYIRPKCSYYVGIDISSSMLKKSLENSKGEELNLIQAATHALPFRDNFFDLSFKLFFSNFFCNFISNLSPICFFSFHFKFFLKYL